MALSQLGTTFTTFLFHRWNQRICPSQNDDDVGWKWSDLLVPRSPNSYDQRGMSNLREGSRTTPGLPRSGICFHLRPFASEMNANYAKA
ncbi:hypothetical protein PROFUN_15780 [Planoprotostelium fungivorum]|uniref:Uncharacterized protein n=1 Tax=Planoprotostelium fungivorum TaxID=1890364 RepID=A0A2P6MQ08_9EUKA|nr:hypothetical protein PROFUN_15780 [Planoprotostelium fungivorum]